MCLGERRELSKGKETGMKEQEEKGRKEGKLDTFLQEALNGGTDSFIK